MFIIQPTVSYYRYRNFILQQFLVSTPQSTRLSYPKAFGTGVRSTTSTTSFSLSTYLQPRHVDTTTMAPVGPRVSKEEFMLALGLNPHDAHHEQYYRAMRDEAIMVYNRMHQDTSHLLDNVRADPNTRPPFFWHHIRPDRQRWGIMEIWRNAGPLTRPLFDRGGTNGEYGPNWVAGWLLYSVFRSRDVRNNRNRRKGETGANGEADKKTKQTEETASPKKGYYDPVRNGTL